MPGFNGTGPRGMGSGTGWGRGPCGAGRRNGCFGGRGQGWNATPYGEPYPTEVSAQADLSSQVQALRSQLQALEKHLEGLKGSQES